MQQAVGAMYRDHKGHHLAINSVCIYTWRQHYSQDLAINSIYSIIVKTTMQREVLLFVSMALPYN